MRSRRGVAPAHHKIVNTPVIIKAPVRRPSSAMAAAAAFRKLHRWFCPQPRPVSPWLPQPGDLDAMFDLAPVSLWVEDYSELKRKLDGWRAEGVTDLVAYLGEDPPASATAWRC
jgi:hypothetical protein